MSPTHPELVHLLRGGQLESAHRGALAVVDADGACRLSIGDIDRPVFPRSAVKLLQALPLVESGAADALGLSDAELALACASHGGEPAHVATAASMLAKAGLDAGVLGCGSHWPYAEAAQRALAVEGHAPGPLHNNCSGKHAGFVCLGCLMARQAGVEPAAYLQDYVGARHPVMRAVGAALSQATGVDVEHAPTGIDGCSIPTHAMPLRAMALAFARVATGHGLAPGMAAAARRLRGAVAAAPFQVAGTGRFDTRVIERLGDRVVCKVGAEGVYCAALPEAGLGVALKVDDGNTARAAEVVMAAVLAALLRLDDDERRFITGLHDVALHNWNGIAVGRLRATDELLQRLAA